MKAVMLSLRPQWCEKIFNGSKTIEVRKSRPSIPTPFKVYVYMTKHKWIFKLLPFLKNRFAKVIGSFVCDKIYDITPVPYYEETCGYKIPQAVIDDSCLTAHDIIIYLTRKDTRVNAYGWHISDLKIYDKPKELGEFSYPAEHNFTKRTIKECREMGFICHGVYITRPPQPWTYCEPIEEE
jgi:hypothetical protein